VYAPGVLTAGVVALVIGAGRYGLLTAGAPVAVVFAAEMLLGAGTLALILRFGPVPGLRHRLRTRLATAGVDTGIRGRVLGVALGRP
jgi:hypothetical protein